MCRSLDALRPGAVRLRPLWFGRVRRPGDPDVPLTPGSAPTRTRARASSWGRGHRRLRERRNRPGLEVACGTGGVGSCRGRASFPRWLRGGPDATPSPRRPGTTGGSTAAARRPAALYDVARRGRRRPCGPRPRTCACGAHSRMASAPTEQRRARTRGRGRTGRAGARRRGWAGQSAPPRRPGRTSQQVDGPAGDLPVERAVEGRPVGHVKRHQGRVEGHARERPDGGAPRRVRGPSSRRRRATGRSRSAWRSALARRRDRGRPLGGGGLWGASTRALRRGTPRGVHAEAGAARRGRGEKRRMRFLSLRPRGRAAASRSDVSALRRLRRHLPRTASRSEEVQPSSRTRVPQRLLTAGTRSPGDGSPSRSVARDPFEGGPVTSRPASP